MLSFRTLGGLALACDARPLTGAATQRRPLALLAVLAVAGDRPVSRERLQALFWPERDEAHARRVLTQTVYALRRDLGDAAVVVGTVDLALNPTLVCADVREFSHAVSACDLERAAMIYGGPFLDGVHLADAPEFNRWADDERTRLGHTARQILERLAEAATASADAEKAVVWWRRLAGLDPLNARGALGLMQALAAMGDPAGALRHARVHEALLREEFGVLPDPAVTAFAARLRAPVREATPAASSTSLPREEKSDVPTASPTVGVDPAPSPTPSGDGLWNDTPTKTRAPTVTREFDARSSSADMPRAPAEWRPDAKSPQSTRRGWMLASAAMGVLVVGLFATFWRRNQPASWLDPALVVVAPFDVAGPGLGVWREGMVDVLSRNLDGAGPLRTVSPTVVVRRWAGHADRAAVADFARALGAGMAVYGGLVPAGRDSVEATVSLLDVRSGRSLVDVRRREALEHMGRLGDSITVAVVQGMAGRVNVDALRHHPLGTARSVAALRAFLDGEQAFRQAQWEAATTAYEQATTLDTAFTLAWHRLGVVTSWQRLLADSLSAAYLLRAGALNRGLGVRDSLLVAADSQAAAANTTPESMAAWQFTRRLFTTLSVASQRYPDDPEVWFALGEARYHLGFGPVVGVSERLTLDAFDRAIALDSAFAPAYIHAVELGFNLGGAPLGLRYARRYLALNPSEPAHRGVVVAVALADSARAGSPETARLLDTVPTSALVSARTILRRWPDAPESAVRLSRLLAAGRPSAYALFADTTFMRRRLAEQLAFRGHLSEAYRVLGRRDLPIFAELALLGAVPTDTARTVFDRWLREGRAEARLALAWWADQGDTSSLREFGAAAGARLRRDTTVSAQADAVYDTTAARAYLELARGDSTRAVAAFASLPDTLCPSCYGHRLTRARLLAARGRHRDALADLAEPLAVFLTPLEVAFSLERARTAARVGDVVLAESAYRFVAAAWAHADPSLRGAADAARRGRVAR